MFVTLVAAMMAMTALPIDAMLSALPDIGGTFHVALENQRQWVITAYLFGLGAAQIVHGPLSDRFGRRPVLLIGLGVFMAFSLLCAVTTSFTALIVARGLQGAGAAAVRVVAVSLVRDCYAGRRMARVMSLVFLIFLLVPILAPAIGQLVLLVAPWRWLFVLLGLFGAAILAWAGLRLPETLSAEGRRDLDPRALVAAWRIVAMDRASVGYTIALTLLSGALFGFIASVQQIVSDTFAAPARLALLFAMIGGSMAVGSLLNSRIVERIGTRCVSHSAIFGFVAISVLQLLAGASGRETLIGFACLQALIMFCFSLCGANFGAMAMENLGAMAGTAASLQGFVSSVGGVLIGFVIGQSFDGGTVPMAAGFTLLGATSVLAVLFAERGRLFRPHGVAGLAAR